MRRLRISPQPTRRARPTRWTSTAANTSCSSGTTRAVPSRANITSQEICRHLQKEWTGKGVVWFTVISSAPGAQGYVTPAQENDYLAKMHAAPTAALLDPDGKVGRLYNAKTTPDMFIIDPQGKLIYAGAIDNRPTPDTGDIQGADNYVSDALSCGDVRQACGHALHARLRMLGEIPRLNARLATAHRAITIRSSEVRWPADSDEAANHHAA